MSQNTLLKTEENLPEMCREIRLFGSSLSSKHPNDIDLLFVARGGWGNELAEKLARNPAVNVDFLHYHKNTTNSQFHCLVVEEDSPERDLFNRLTPWAGAIWSNDTLHTGRLLQPGFILIQPGEILARH